MLVIGLTGSLGTGKSTVAGMFARWGAKIINADQIAHELIAPQGACVKPVVKAFGTSIVKGNRIDRGRLAKIVFNDLRKLRRLERIIHPAVGKKMTAQLMKMKSGEKVQVVILDIPLMFESGLNRLADYTMVVTTSQQTQLKRAVSKFNITKDEALRRIRSQMPLREKIRRADIIIDNNGTLTETYNQVNEIWQRLRQKIKKRK